MAVELSFCVVNTEQRELLVRCLDAIAAEREGLPFETEVLVLDNASRDGSAAAARRHALAPEVIALDRRAGKGENDTALLKRARGRYALLLNEDSELRPGAVRPCATRWRSATTPRPPARGCCAPTAPASPARGASRRRRRRWSARSSCTSASRCRAAGERTRTVDWAQSAALLVRTDAAREIEWFDPAFFVYSDEVDFCRRLRDAGWRTLYVPAAVAVHHEQLSTGKVPERRIVELSRNRDRYMRKHHSRRRPPRWCGCSRRGPTRCARSRRSRCPATTRGATGAT